MGNKKKGISLVKNPAQSDLCQPMSKEALRRVTLKVCQGLKEDGLSSWEISYAAKKALRLLKDDAKRTSGLSLVRKNPPSPR
jgi:hypothetical protein